MINLDRRLLFGPIPLGGMLKANTKRTKRTSLLQLCLNECLITVILQRQSRWLGNIRRWFL